MAYYFNLGGGGVVIDNLITPNPAVSLSANQGKVLEQQILSLTGHRTVVPVLAGQTAITLPTIPTDLTSVVMFVNGVGYAINTDYTVSGTGVVTWASFVLAPADNVSFTYV